VAEPRYRDPDLDSSNTVWAWIAGATVVALVLLFVFGNRGRETTEVTEPAACKVQTLPGGVVEFGCSHKRATTALSKYLEENDTHRVKAMSYSQEGLTVVLE
jgi:hypothetical protein